MVSALHFKKAVLSLAFLLVLLTLFLSNIFAGSGLVSQVGGAAFIQGAGQFWVTSSKPLFSGIATAGSAVTGTVGTEAVAATADASGNWSWAPSVDLAGDNSVSITSGTEIVSFTLTIGNLPENIATASASTLPPAGSLAPTLIALGLGSILLLAGAFGLARNFFKS